MALYGLYSAFSGQVFYEQYMNQVFNLVFTSMPIVLFAVQDCEFTKEQLLNNPKLFNDGPENVHYNTAQFFKWIAYTLFHSVLVLVVSFIGMNFTFNTSIEEAGGKTADMWLMGSLVYAVVVCHVNNKLLQDSNTLNFLVIFFNVMSSVSFVLVFWIVD